MELVPVLFLTALLVGYFVLAGCDVGLGMLMPYLARTRGERRRAVSAAAPYFLGTEVWLVGAVGVVAGLFPGLKTAVVSDLWPVFAVLTAGWLLRDAGLWLRARTDARAWHAAWDAAIVGGSWTLAVCWGLAAGALLAGGVLSPLALAVAACTVVLFLLRGAAFGAERLVPVPSDAGPAEGPHSALSADAAARLTRVLARAGLAVLAVAVALGALPGALEGGRPLAAGAGAVVVAVALAAMAGTEGPGRSRHASAAAMAVLVPAVGLGAALPVEPVPGAVLVLVSVALAPMVPLMVAGQAALYRMLRRPAPASGFFARVSPAPAGGALPGGSRFRPTGVGGPRAGEPHRT
ncbi:cytochrome d ubiquinol oxidase subunit II [Nocardiopsis halophila]|uniref:cytochrome d ubiquinol oxidase subunit II n=1 Tax=Nocardiopsis halophila TaxID=141692 RepID=UPI0003454C29|nr:cytochrome d ubiquinol oxidase subunit II [Nocardiopsis halophila]